MQEGFDSELESKKKSLETKSICSYQTYAHIVVWIYLEFTVLKMFLAWLLFQA